MNSRLSAISSVHEYSQDPHAITFHKSTFTGYLANAFLSPRSAASPSDPDDPRAQLEMVRQQLDKNAREAAELQSKLKNIVELL